MARRKVPAIDLTGNEYGIGRELFAGFRQMVTRAEHGPRRSGGREVRSA